MKVMRCMCRNRRVCPILLVVLLTGCVGASGQSSDEKNEMLMLEVLETVQEQENQAVYQTIVLEKADISASYGASASLVFPYGTVISYENEYASITFEQYLTESGSFVKEGQELVRLSRQINEADELEVSRAYERVSHYYEIACQDYEERLAGMDLGETRYAQLAYEYKCYQEDTERELAALTEQLAAYEEIRRQPEVVLTAPFDGYVSELADIVSGSSIPSGSGLLMLQNTDIWYYELSVPERDNTVIPLGASAALTLENEDGTTTAFSGTVIKSDIVLESMKTGTAWVEFDRIEVNGTAVEYIDVTALPDTAPVEVNMIFFENVLVVPSDYVHLEDDDCYYVKRLQDGVIEKVYFVAPVANVSGKYWALSGLNEGDVLVAD